jgi:hypothetical protein
VITGYNTDVRHNDVVYHVQTEDKGLSNPYIESLLYVGGQILANKRTSYAEILAEGKGERAILALMDHQHRTMIAAIRAAKFEKKLAALRGTPLSTSSSSDTGLTALPEAAVAHAGETADTPAAALPANDETQIATPERSLDQVILDYLTIEAEQEQLVLEVDADGELMAGATAMVGLATSSSKTGTAIPGAKVVAKFISTITGPATLAIGETDAQGHLQLELEIPPITRGTAALIIVAASNIGRAEFKHLL